MSEGRIEQGRIHEGPAPTIEALVTRIEDSGEQGSIDEARELVRGVLALHKEGLERFLELVRKAGQESLLRELASDPLVAGLLILHDLHPDSFEDRARSAVERVALTHPGLRLDSVTGSSVKVRLAETGVGASLIARIVESELAESLPDASRVEVVEEPALIQLRRKDER